MRRSLAALLLVMASLAGAAHADIRAFNAAVQAGDYRGATQAAAETWPTIDRASPDAVAIAREFAWIAMLADEPAVALGYARFLVDEGRTLAHPDATPATSRVLHDWAGLASTVSPQTRARLLASLNARATIAGNDLISARAAQVLHVEAWAAGDWQQAHAAAQLAIRFFGEVGATQSPALFELRRGLAASSFMQAKSPEAYNAVYDVATELHDLIAATSPGPTRERLAAEYFTAIAWGDAMYSALGSRQRSTPDRRQSITAGRKPMAELLYPAPGDASLPRCRISMASKISQPGFPYVSRFKDFGGVVIYALRVDPSGAFTNPRLLATAPHDGVAQEIADETRKWRWKLDSGSTANCRMPDTHVLTLEFALGR
jgi:hypothetical protein